MKNPQESKTHTHTHTHKHMWQQKSNPKESHLKQITKDKQMNGCVFGCIFGLETFSFLTLCFELVVGLADIATRATNPSSPVKN